MITRQQYMDSNGKLFRQYYAQFVTPTIKNMVLTRFGAKKLKLALEQDENLNSIPLKEWDILVGWTGRGVSLPLPRNLLKETGEGISCSTAICTVKEAARQIVEENN